MTPIDYEDAQQQNRGYDPNFVPDSVKSFMVHLYSIYVRRTSTRSIRCTKPSSTLSPTASSRTLPISSIDVGAHYVNNDHIFCLLYPEMWFHHLYARLTPTLRQKIDSWDNYCSLF
ncbi:hypothetical protein PIB30_025358 [Stylosanthes scabra]|uniref:Uncharacterized protein n=1 Tax=Stylosanthes scabra TaxID=79078 RepID=A0ABU6Y793_9FABA|nr:hypothetical protein [Stylosanthes scabra]